MIADDRKQLMLNMMFKFGKELTKDINLNLLLSGKLKGRKLSYLNVTLDLCEDFGSPKNHFIVRLFLNEFLRKSNIHLKCPTITNVMYEVRNFTLDDRYALNFLPSLTWTALLKFNYENRKVLILQAVGRYDNDKS